MRRQLAVAVATAATLGCPAAVSAQTPSQDSVVGSSHDCTSPGPCPAVPSTITLYTQLTANARSGSTGQGPSGTVRWTDRIAGDFLTTETHVTCLSVTDHVAIVGVAGTRTSARFGYSLAVAGLVRITDGGGTASGLDTFESAIQMPIPPLPPPPDPTDCSSFPAGAVPFHNEQGNLVVTDARPVPASKTACKHGGWRTYGSFNSQSDCVRFVRHQARGECVFIRAAIGRPAFRAQYGSGGHKRHAMRRCIRERMND
jgi:hypothetical protein